MMIDITGIELTPGNCGKDCLGNGLHEGYECCCDECNYMMCCLPSHTKAECIICADDKCPFACRPQHN